MRYYLSLFLVFLCTLAVSAQSNPNKYLAGAVPQNEQGVVVFSKTYQVPNKSQQQIYDALQSYTDKYIIHGENALPQTKYVEKEDSLLAIRVEEYLYFKKKAWVTHRTRFYYDLVYHIENGGFTVSLQRLHYIYEPEESPNGYPEDYRAEQWITDANALNKKGKLTRIAGKFRKFTIDRKDEIFRASAKAAGAKLKTRTIEIED